MVTQEPLEKEDIEAIAQRISEIMSTRKANDNSDNLDYLFDVEGLAVYLKVPVDWVYGKKYKGEIPYEKAGKYLRFRKSAIDAWLKNNKKV